MNKHPYWTSYAADKNGSVYGKSGIVMKPILHHTGYHVYTIRMFGKQKQVRAHRFIWECLVGEIPHDKVLNHKDGDKTNNSLDNLECVSQSENSKHAFDNKLRVGQKGPTNPSSKLTEEQFYEIVDLLPRLSNKQIGDKYGLHPNYVSLIRHKKRWKSYWKKLERSETIRKEYAPSGVEAVGTRKV